MTNERSTVAANCNTETKIEMRDDGTVEHFPEGRLEDVALGGDELYVVAVVVVREVGVGAEDDGAAGAERVGVEVDQARVILDHVSAIQLPD